MNRLLKTHPAAAEFGLNRDPIRWGVASTSASPAIPGSSEPSAAGFIPPIVYALRPPWVANDILRAAHKLLEQPIAGTTSQQQPQLSSGSAAPGVSDGGAADTEPDDY